MLNTTNYIDSNSSLFPDMHEENQNQNQKVHSVTTLFRNLNENSVKSEGIIIRGYKVVVSTINFVTYPIYFIFSSICSFSAIGSSKSTRSINTVNRAELENLKGENIRFKFENQAILEGMYFEAEKEEEVKQKKTFLICSGSHASFEASTIPMVKGLLAMGHNVMIFNYEGFGNSQGRRTEKGIYESTEAALQYLIVEKGCKEEDIVGYGYSLGSAAVIDLAQRHEKIKIVVDAGISSMTEKAKNDVPWGFQTITSIAFSIFLPMNNVKKIKKLTNSILIVHRKQDKLMPKEHHADLLFDAATSKNKQLLEVNGNHEHRNDIWFSNGNTNVKKLSDFLSNG